MKIIRGLMVGLTFLATVTLAAAGGTAEPKDVVEVKVSSPATLIVGKWKVNAKEDGVELKATVEFTKDGVLKIKAGGLEVDANYKLIDGSRLEVTFADKVERVKIESINK